MSAADIIRWIADRLTPADINDVWPDTEDDE